MRKNRNSLILKRGTGAPCVWKRREMDKFLKLALYLNWYGMSLSLNNPDRAF
jgi:hypothetical protein